MFMALKVRDAAKIIGAGYGYVVALLQQDKCPFGTGVRHESGRWSYHISEKLLREYVGDERVDEYLEGLKQ